MKNEELIIRLIQQDMKHSQMLSALESIGLSAEGTYYLGLQEIIGKLMKVPEDDTSERWNILYLDFMDEASHLEQVSRSDSLRPLAEKCYSKLQELLKGN